MSIFSYTKPDHPKYIYNSNDLTLQENNNLRVVSFNIEKALAIDQAISELENNSDLRGADILLLQEMDEKGTSRIAHHFQYNYIYYPFSKSPGTDVDFGNSILSKYPITMTQKLILPYTIYKDGRKRMVTCAKIEVGGKSVLVASVHLHTVIMPRVKRIRQSQYLVDFLAMSTNFDYMIVGGDYNTVIKAYRKKIVEQYRQIGLDWATHDMGSTGSALLGIVKPANDHIFTKGFKIQGIGKYAETLASDHYPIWVDLSF